MKRKHYEIVYRRSIRDSFDADLLSIFEVAELSDLHPETIGRLMALGLIEPEIKEPTVLFTYKTVLRVRCIFRLRKDMGVNLASAGIILDLLDQIDYLKQEVLKLQQRLVEKGTDTYLYDA